MELVLVTVIAVAFIVAHVFENSNNGNIHDEGPEFPFCSENEVPLQDTTYRAQNQYNNTLQNSRTDAILSVLEKYIFGLQ